MTVKMNNVAIALLSNVTAINVRFERSGGLYTYLTKRTDIAVGDKVVVDTPRAGLVVVEVQKVGIEFDIDAHFEYKFIVDKVDLTANEELKETLQAVKLLIEEERKSARKAEVLATLGLKADLLTKIALLDK